MSQAQDFFRKGIASAQAGDLASAESALRKCLSLDPKNALAMLNLGLVLKNSGKLEAAEQMLFQSVNIQATLESITALANVLTMNGKLGKAEECYRVILQAVPNHSPTMARIAELADGEGDRKKARDWFKRAWNADPNNLQAGISYAINSFFDDSTETSLTLKRLLELTRSDSSNQQKVLTGLLPYKEFHERKKRGLMPYHATSLDELFFTFAKPEFEKLRELSLAEAEKKLDAATASKKFTALFCSGDRKGAQECLEYLGDATQNHILGNVTFDPGFYRKLEAYSDEELTNGLPPVTQILTADFSAAPVVYLACNYFYFASFCMPMIRSLKDRQPDAQLHLHVMDISETEVKTLKDFCAENEPLKFSVTIEQTGLTEKKAARSYYHAIRFIRFYMHLKEFNRTLWLMDVDALFNRPASAMFETLKDNDAAFRIRAGRLEPWNQFNACIIGATPKPASVRYFRLIAAYIAYFHQQKRLQWGIDQAAMYGVFEYLRDQNVEPKLALLDDRVIDYDYLDDGIVWCNSGRNKFLHLDRKPGVPLAELDPDRAKYLQLFEKYLA